MRQFLLALAVLPALTACESAYLATMEKFGVAKREILVDRIFDAREEQQEAKEQIQTTFDVFKELTGSTGGELESIYNRLSDEYEDSVDSAEDVSDRIDKIESVAEKMYSEWESEIGEIQNPELRADSERDLRDTRKRSDDVVTSMRASEAKMEPVLQSFKDYVLALKHKLNAQYIASLDGTAIQIEGDVQQLIGQMEASIAEADEFLESMKGEG